MSEESANQHLKGIHSFSLYTILFFLNLCTYFLVKKKICPFWQGVGRPPQGFFRDFSVASTSLRFRVASRLDRVATRPEERRGRVKVGSRSDSFSKSLRDSSFLFRQLQRDFPFGAEIAFSSSFWKGKKRVAGRKVLTGLLRYSVIPRLRGELQLFFSPTGPMPPIVQSRYFVFL
jgi:hypothetical protein